MNPLSLSSIKSELHSRNVWDASLLMSLLVLISFGLVMVASSSIDFAASRYDDPWFFIRKQVVFLGIGIIAGLIVCAIPLKEWSKASPLLLALAFALLVAVLIPGIGKVVNGSRRWLSFGSIGFQASEFAKFCLIVFFASYLSRREKYVQGQWQAFAIMVGVIGVSVVLLMAEPDLGSCVVLCFTLGMMMFVAGVPVLRFLLLSLVGLSVFSLILYFSSWRLERLLAFMDPWSRQFDSGYQLVQSLIAFGRGEWFGLGLGNSLQKLFFLPEAHTDFIFAIVAEELGLVGAVALIATYVVFIGRILKLSNLAALRGDSFASYLCLGIACLLGAQAFINMGVASGLLPTKGLTLPFVSYGGSSLSITCVLVALVLRVNKEHSYEQS